MELPSYIPNDKFDVAAIERATTVGFPTLDPIIPELLEWLQDANWPVANATASLLVNAGNEIIPHLKHALNSNDSIWKYWLITLLIENFPPEMFEKVRVDMEALANNPTKSDLEEDVDLAAKAIISKFNSCVYRETYFERF